MFNSHLLGRTRTRGAPGAWGASRRPDQPPSSTVSGIWWQVSSVSASGGSSRRHSWGVVVHAVTGQENSKKDQYQINGLPITDQKLDLFLTLPGTEISFLWEANDPIIGKFNYEKIFPFIEQNCCLNEQVLLYWLILKNKEHNIKY